MYVQIGKKRKYRKKSDIFVIFENIAIFSNPDSQWIFILTNNSKRTGIYLN